MRAADPSDAELVRRALSGDREAFGRLYDRHARLVRVVAADAGPARAEDVVQEAFLRAYRKLGTLRGRDRFAPWLVGIARKVVREARRKPAGEPLPAAVPDGRPGPATDADNADEAAHLRALVARLPEEQRQAVQFFFLSGRDAVAVARLLGRSRSGTYALLRQAVGTLARWMGAKLPPGEVRR
jgi:RNA polymerase sigma-70 factor, ECF subfamily